MRRKLRSIWRRLFHRRRIEADLDDELRSYYEEETQRKIRAGESSKEAYRKTVLENGGLEQTKESCRDVRRLRWAESFMQDVRFSLRTLRRYPGVTTIAALSLALGIGANTLVFSFV